MLDVVVLSYYVQRPLSLGVALGNESIESRPARRRSGFDGLRWTAIKSSIKAMVVSSKSFTLWTSVTVLAHVT